MNDRSTFSLPRIGIGILALFAAWLLGGRIAAQTFPGSPLSNKMETVASKVGSSFGIALISLALARYVLLSTKDKLACLVGTEAIVCMVVMGVSGLNDLSWSSLSFNLWWLWALTWNVVAAFGLVMVVCRKKDQRLSGRGERRVE